MAPASTLDWSEPCQQWRYPKLCPSGQRHERTKNGVELNGKEANGAYKKFCKFLRQLGSKRRFKNIDEGNNCSLENYLSYRPSIGTSSIYLERKHRKRISNL
ncbi:glycogen synthase kinase-3 beta isoform X1 [Vespula squamosa]|uniref:Glycogen synthase kinase-3 beta isoform X1 n=1 Tax=Vespula squamosa TaxID=30214 RepID=A0ABD1ZV55_VESSQ